MPFILLKDGNTHITSTLLWHARQSLATSSARETCTTFISSVTVHFHHHLNGQGHFALSLLFSSVKFDRIGHVLLELSFSPQDSASSSPFPRMSPSLPHQGRHLPETRRFIINDAFPTLWPQDTEFFSVSHLPLPPRMSPPPNHFSCSSSHPPPGMFCWAISWMFPCRGPTGPSHWRGRTLTSFAPSHHLCLLTPSFPSVIPRDRTYAEDHPAALPDSRVTSPVNSPLLGLLMALPGYRCFLYVLIVSHRYYFHGSYVSSLPSPHHYLNTAMRLTCPQFFSFSLSCSETSGACSYLLCRAYSPLFPDWWPSPALSIGTSHPRCQFLPNAQPWFQPCSLCSEDIKCVSVLAPHHPVLARHHSFSLNPAISPIAWMNPQGITEWKKTISKGSILCDFIYKTFWNDKVFFLSSWRVVDSQCCVSFQV